MMMKQVLTLGGYMQSENGGVWQRESFDGIDYNDGDTTEDGLLATLRAASDVSIFSSELSAACVDWPSRYHLSSERANLLRPFAERLGPGTRVLEIGAGCGAVTRYLGECGAEVLALEGSQRRARIARERTRELDNVSVLAERFQDLSLDASFDVVTLIGVLEYAGLFSDSPDPALHMLRQAHALLAPGGRLLVAIENQLGLKYLAGVPEDHLGVPMSGVEDRYAERGVRTFGRQKLQRLLAEAGFAQSRFLVPLPDYKMPRTVLSELGAQTDPRLFDAGALASQSVRLDPQLTATAFNLQRAWPVVSQNGLTTDLANSFLVEASVLENSPAGDAVLAWHFSTQRIGRFARETRFVRVDDGQTRVRTSALVPVAECDGVITDVRFVVEDDTEYLQGTLLVEPIREVFSRPGWRIDDLVVEFRRYVEGLASVLAHDGVDVKTDRLDVVLPDDYIDATPSNLIRERDGRVAYIDREWAVDGPTLGWLLVRSLLFTYAGSTAVPMDGDVPLTLRGLIESALGRMFDMPVAALVDDALERELRFQQSVTGRDQSQAVDRLLQTPMAGRSETNGPVAAPAQIVDMLATLQHAMNLGAQHGLNMHASIQALSTAVADLHGKAVPALDRLQAEVQQMAVGQAALHDRLVGTDDRLEASLARWGDEHETSTAQLRAVLEEEQRQSALDGLRGEVAALREEHAKLIAGYEDMLRRRSRRWWMFR